MLQALREQIQGQRSADVSPTRRSVDPIGLTVAVGIGYFLAARLSLFLLAKPDGVAVFWPAAGISSGILIAFGREVRWPVAIGTMAATIVANLTSDRTIWNAIASALCNAGEALFVAWLIERYFGVGFSLGRLRQVLGLLAAAIVATAASGVPATVAYRVLQSPDAPVFTTWQHWVASDAIGIITVAPSIIGFASAEREPPLWRELVEGAVALVLVAALMGIIVLAASELGDRASGRTAVPCTTLAYGSLQTVLCCCSRTGSIPRNRLFGHLSPWTIQQRPSVNERNFRCPGRHSRCSDLCFRPRCAL